VPTAIPASTKAAFVAPGGVISVEGLTLGGPTLTQAKIAAIAMMTRETVEHAAGEVMITTL
jgi:hypothetical protein